MSPQWRRLLPLLLMLLLALAVSFGWLGGHTANKSNLIGYQVAPFDLPVLGSPGQRFSPKSWQGRVVVLNVFASWSKPSLAEHSALMKLAQSSKVLVYGLAWKDKPENAAAFINQNGNPYQLIGIDEHGVTSIPLALTGVPETFIIARDGSIYYDRKEPLTDELVDTLILPLVEKLNETNAR